MSKRFLLFITSIFLPVQLIELYDTKCPYSLPTIEKVHSCPKNKEEANIASDRKKCKTLANLQNCTVPSKFVYHCVPNTWQNETLEVCAPKIFSLGYCVEFNILGERIQELRQACYNDENNKCPSRFNSSDLYLYDSCFRKTENTLETNTSYKIDPEIDLTTILLILILLLMTIISCVVLICFYKRKLECVKSHATSETRIMRPVCNVEQKVSEQTSNKIDSSGIPSAKSTDTDGAKKSQETQTTSPMRQSLVHHSHHPNYDYTDVYLGSCCSSDAPLLSKDLAYQSLTFDRIQRATPSLFSRTSRCNTYQSDISSLKPTSEISFHSGVRGAEGYDIDSLNEFVEEYNLSDLLIRFNEHGFNCIAPVLTLTQQEMMDIGFKVGEIKRCQMAIEDYKQKREQKRNSTDKKGDEENENI